MIAIDRGWKSQRNLTRLVAHVAVNYYTNNCMGIRSMLLEAGAVKRAVAALLTVVRGDTVPSSTLDDVLEDLVTWQAHATDVEEDAFTSSHSEIGVDPYTHDLRLGHMTLTTLLGALSFVAGPGEQTSSAFDVFTHAPPSKELEGRYRIIDVAAGRLVSPRLHAAFITAWEIDQREFAIEMLESALAEGVA